FMVGCTAIISLAGLLLLAGAWFGPPPGTASWHGLAVLFSSDLVHTNGTVIRFDAGGTSKQRLAIPVVQFEIGRHAIVFHGIGSNSNPFSIGQQVPIAYRKSDPEDAYIRTFGQELFVPLLLILLSAPCLVIGGRAAYVIIRDRASQRSRQKSP